MSIELNNTKEYSKANTDEESADNVVISIGGVSKTTSSANVQARRSGSNVNLIKQDGDVTVVRRASASTSEIMTAIARRNSASGMDTLFVPVEAKGDASKVPDAAKAIEELGGESSDLLVLLLNFIESSLTLIDVTNFKCVRQGPWWSIHRAHVSFGCVI